MPESLPDQRRYLFIDLFRGAAILLMLQGHAFRALLDPPVQQHPVYQFFEIIHGITAPAFLFGAGLTFVISTRRHWQEYHHIGKPLVRRVGRVALVILLGLSLHLPYFSLRKILSEGTTEDVLQLFQFDILHCIGFGLLILQALIFFFRTERRFYLAVVALAIIIPILTPLVWDVDFLHIYPPAIAQMFDSRHGSPFPLFPFVAFLFAGVLISWEFLQAAEHGSQSSFMRRLFWLGPLIAAGAILMDIQPVRLYPTYNFWYTSPNYFAIRVGVLLVLTATIWYLARSVENLSPKRPLIGRTASVVSLLGKESLVIYVVHLPFLYGSFIYQDVSFRGVFGSNLGLGTTALIFLAILLAMTLLAKGWSVLKTSRVAYRSVQAMIAGMFLYYLLTRPY